MVLLLMEALDLVVDREVLAVQVVLAAVATTMDLKVVA
jgi:hypothetical protein